MKQATKKTKTAATKTKQPMGHGLPDMDQGTRRVVAAIANRLWAVAEARAKADTERTATSIVALLDRLGISMAQGLAIVQHLAAGKSPAQVPVEPSLVANRLDRLVDAAAQPKDAATGFSGGAK